MAHPGGGRIGGPKYDLGFLGGGQLARMSIMAAQRMGIRCISLDSSEESPASRVAESLVGSLREARDIERLFEAAEFVTLENEFIPAATIEEAMRMGSVDSSRLSVRPAALALVQDKLLQRNALVAAGVASPRAVALEGDAEEAISTIGFPMVLKARFGGYDGRGTRYATTLEELESHRSEWSGGGWLAEDFVPFERELAVMSAVTANGNFSFPTVETVQTRSVCDLVFPSNANGAAIAEAAVAAVGGTGLFGVELFQLANGEVLVNELAPRPHNSGHYTLDWGGPTQFEFHVRCALGLPLEPIESPGYAVMANLFGIENPGCYRAGLTAALEIPNVSVHWYEKAESRLGRKMGHLNVRADSRTAIRDAVEAAKFARGRFYEAWSA